MIVLLLLCLLFFALILLHRGLQDRTQGVAVGGTSRVCAIAPITKTALVCGHCPSTAVELVCGEVEVLF